MTDTPTPAPCTILLDPDKIKAAATILRDTDDGGDERPSLAVYEAAVVKWIENAANAMLSQPDYYAYGASRRLDWDHWTDALAHAEHWHSHPLVVPTQPVRMCADRNCLNAADPTTPAGAFCLQHDAQLRTECGIGPAPDQIGPERWTAEQILRREG